MKQLQELWLQGFTRISDAGMPHLSGLVGLWTLRLRNTMVTDAGMVLVGQFPELTSLNLDFTSVTDAGARHLESLKKLRELTSAMATSARKAGSA